jgi:hypothetical protein
MHASFERFGRHVSGAFERGATAASRNRQRSFGAYLPLPSVNLRWIEVDARSGLRSLKATVSKNFSQ